MASTSRYRNNSAPRLVLCAGRDLEIDGKVGQKGANVGWFQLARVTHLMKADVAGDPVDVALLGATRVMFAAEARTHRGAQLRLGLAHRASAPR